MSEQKLFWPKMLRYASLYTILTGLLPVLAVFDRPLSAILGGALWKLKEK